jgi:hypothetical protein
MAPRIDVLAWLKGAADWIRAAVDVASNGLMTIGPVYRTVLPYQIV